MVVSQFGTTRRRVYGSFGSTTCVIHLTRFLFPAGFSRLSSKHRSIQVTIDGYGHLIPDENVAWIDTLDSIPKKVAATDAHQSHMQSRESEEEISGTQSNRNTHETCIEGSKVYRSLCAFSLKCQSL